jgi:Flp pilus assembly protein TadG
MISKLLAGVCRLIPDRRGVAAVEFALVAPLLLCMYFVTMEVAQGIEANK